MNYMYNEPPFKSISEENPQYNYYLYINLETIGFKFSFKCDLTGLKNHVMN